jgi:thioredoxin reductase
MEEATLLTGFAETVTILHRRDATSVRTLNPAVLSFALNAAASSSNVS